MRMLIKVFFVFLLVVSPVVGEVVYAGNGIQMTYNEKTHILVYEISPALMDCKLSFLTPDGKSINSDGERSVYGRGMEKGFDKRTYRVSGTRGTEYVSILGNLATITCYNNQGDVVIGSPVRLGNAPQKQSKIKIKPKRLSQTELTTLASRYKALAIKYASSPGENHLASDVVMNFTYAAIGVTSCEQYEKMEEQEIVALKDNWMEFLNAMNKEISNAYFKRYSFAPNDYAIVTDSNYNNGRFSDRAWKSGSCYWRLKSGNLDLIPNDENIREAMPEQGQVERRDYPVAQPSEKNEGGGKKTATKEHEPPTPALKAPSPKEVASLASKYKTLAVKVAKEEKASGAICIASNFMFASVGVKRDSARSAGEMKNLLMSKKEVWSEGKTLIDSAVKENLSWLAKSSYNVTTSEMKCSDETRCWYVDCLRQAKYHP